MTDMFRRLFKKPVSFDSANYWETRYRTGGNSGAGSYNELAAFKAEVVNEAVKEFGIERMIEFGCGDGNQLLMYKVPEYTGLDVSATVLQQCISIFAKDAGKSFFIYDMKCFTDKTGVFLSDAAISIDVLFHLVEQEVYETYLGHLFGSAQKLVIIYAANVDLAQQSQHELYRKFTPYIEKNFPAWKLERHVPNRHPAEKYEDQDKSLADFFFYTRS